ncbi:MAG: dihydroxyacetone kinase subunit DhaK [Planctomycetota bacterium]|jgi:dihydroxyacetone kinase|nr:dihydroxyacetone kinase subunit DhaK [Planctomycetota bacterium]
MKKIINAPEAVVDEMCLGLALAHNGVENLAKYRIIKRKAINPGKVSLISGGGSGHEPPHAGFVGTGMLDAAVCGDVFASPSQIQIYQAIKAAASPKGTLLIIKNYSGDVMNFQAAAFLAETDGIKVDHIKVADDIAVKDSLYTVGRRGVAGTVLVHKIAGAAAEAGLDLPEVKRIAQKAADRVRSLGFALTSCTVPAKGSPTFALAEDEMEYGVGIHGEPGIHREKTASADQLAARMTAALLEDLKAGPGSRVALLVNGFGATPLQELYILAQAAVRELSERDISAFRLFVGNYMTSIDMAGASISIMDLDAELEKYLAAKCCAPAFKIDGSETPVAYARPGKDGVPHGQPAIDADSSGGGNVIAGNRLSLKNVIFLVDKMAEIIIRNEMPFCELDSHAGDGDFGMSVAKGFRQLKREWKSVLAGHSADIGEFLDACSLIIMEHCGGASGPIWGIAFKYAAKLAAGKGELSIQDAAAMLQAAVDGIQAIGEKAFGRGAVVGDKTLVDALAPCADAWRDCAKRGDDLKAAFAKGAEAAAAGAKSTEKIAARLGRAGALGDRSIGYPDAGAHALGVICAEIAKALED